MRGKSSLTGNPGLKGKRGLLRFLFVFAAGALALASVAWACVSHESPDARPDLRVTGVNSNPENAGFIDANARDNVSGDPAMPSDNPNNDYRVYSTPLRRGGQYLWSASNLQTATAYSLRYAKMGSNNTVPNTPVGSKISYCGEVVDAGMHEQVLYSSTLPFRSTAGHWALTPVASTIPAAAPQGAWSVCVTPTTRAVGQAWPNGANQSVVEFTVL